ncbi:MAG TPA: D-aminoacyl-tRNA deacylase [Bacillota bacterium]|nr:D-aminoacyl-tRNA deacylase [Clostridiaceae bacterium]HNR04108.1 D-aminoacyl-tRNA deacylase [Bacillota bacterium]HNT03140.1 D-aminoacyl-tRNA deacylase [Bacillota bacterium]HPA55162.1 D-aminoacyl-tRNA deacylase [Bacillota bacterium]HPX68198.1 D-aminoacyl-tRNA deacylase [Bacillota bacterium]
MRAVIQRVNSGSVAVDDKIVGSIGKGFVVLLGVNEKDTEADVLYMVDKTVNLRIFEDDNEKMNLSLLDIKGELLVISQFTLYGDCRKGRRPNFMSAARPEKAEELYNEFVKKCRELGVKTETGTFQAYMKVNIENDGPVTVIVDSEKII